jgi:hypothetical protein
MPFASKLLMILGLGVCCAAPLGAQEPVRGSVAAPVAPGRSDGQDAPPPLAAGPSPGGGALDKLTDRDRGLDAREREIQRREQTMKAASEQIDRKVTELKRLQTTLEGRLTPPASR